MVKTTGNELHYTGEKYFRFRSTTTSDLKLKQDWDWWSWDYFRQGTVARIVQTASKRSDGAEEYTRADYSFRRFTQFDDCSGRVGIAANFSDVTAAGDDVTAGTPVDDVTGNTTVGCGATLLARRRATNCWGSSAVKGSSAP